MIASVPGVCRVRPDDSSSNSARNSRVAVETDPWVLRMTGSSFWSWPSSPATDDAAPAALRVAAVRATLRVASACVASR